MWSRLFRILNRLGVCVSADTHARYVQYRVQKCKDEGPMNPYPRNTFTTSYTTTLGYIAESKNQAGMEPPSRWYNLNLLDLLTHKKQVLRGRQLLTQSLQQIQIPKKFRYATQKLLRLEQYTPRYKVYKALPFSVHP